MSAVFSECGAYRYALWRDLGMLGEGTVTFVMLNPSTADAEQDDPTIRRCVHYAERWGFGRLAVANLYAYRATNPKALYGVEDPVGPENDHWIQELASDAAEVIVAWGAQRGPIPGRDGRALELIDAAGLIPQALELTDGGYPRHPLYVRGDVERFPYRVAGAEAA